MSKPEVYIRRLGLLLFVGVVVYFICWRFVTMNGEHFSGTLYVEEHFTEMRQDDPKLILYVRNRYLTPPAKKPLQLRNPGFLRTAIGRWVKEFYHSKRGGVFVEAGAHNGEDSNTIELEIEHKWTGVLIECNSKVADLLRSINRKAWIAQVCISDTKHPKMINLTVPISSDYTARIGPPKDLTEFGITTNYTYLANVEGVPLYTILASVGITEIDFFSFDIEGVELAVLRNFPFDKIKIKVLFLEVYFYNEAEQMELRKLLGDNGLHFVKNIDVNQIYVHESLLNNISNFSEGKIN